MPTPDYQRIAQLERELGIGEQQPERPVDPGRTVCLIKSCTGTDTEIRTWSGILLRRYHQH